MKKVYIAGAITGKIEAAVLEFKTAENALLLLGYEVINPMELPHQHAGEWSDYMRECIIELCKCDFIFLLPGWGSSAGAVLENQLAKKLNIKNLNLPKK